MCTSSDNTRAKNGETKPHCDVYIKLLAGLWGEGGAVCVLYVPVCVCVCEMY